LRRDHFTYAFESPSGMLFSRFAIAHQALSNCCAITLQSLSNRCAFALQSLSNRSRIAPQSLYNRCTIALSLCNPFAKPCAIALLQCFVIVLDEEFATVL
jgi:hypothetical protein